MPFQPQEHLEGSRNLLSIWRTERTAPQFGHSNFAFTTCGLTSEACRTIPSITRSWSRCLALISLILISAFWGMSVSLILGFSMRPDSSSAFSRMAIVSSGFSKVLSESVGENSAREMKLMLSVDSPCRMDFPNSFFLVSKKFFASRMRSSCFLFFSMLIMGRSGLYGLLWLDVGETARKPRRSRNLFLCGFNMSKCTAL